MRRFVATGIALLLLGACAKEAAPPPAPKPVPGPPNVVFVVGDGFGVGAWTLARGLARTRGQELALETAPRLGFLDTRAGDALVTDSAAAASAWSIGELVSIHHVGRPGAEPLGRTLLRAGRPFGFVTTARVTDATPAPFYGTVSDRWDAEEDLVPQLVEARCTVALGGGRERFVGKDGGGTRRADDVDWLARAEAESIAVQLQFSDPLPVDRPVIGLYAAGHLPHELDRTEEPELADMARAAIRRLRAEGRPWFLLVEESHTDTACHDHDGPSVAHDGLRLDRAISAILCEVDLDSTLVVLLADHATDSPAFLEWAHPESLDVVSMSVERMETRIFSGPWRGTPRALEAKALPVLDEGARQTGLTSGDIDRLLVAESGYDRRTALGDAISRRLGISFIAYEDHLASSQVHGHTGELVPIRAWGRGAEAVLGIHRHDEIGRWLREVLEVGGAAEAGMESAGAAESTAVVSPPEG